MDLVTPFPGEEWGMLGPTISSYKLIRDIRVDSTLISTQQTLTVIF